MIIRTPRRRVSLRTKRKYRAIKTFLRNAIGTTSQRKIYTNSSVDLSVSDLKKKIATIEQELNTVSKHCQDISCIDLKFLGKERHRVDVSQIQTTRANYKPESLKNVGTKVIYRKSESCCDKRYKTNTTDIKKSKTMNPQCSYQNSQYFDFKPRAKLNESDNNDFRKQKYKIKSKYKTLQSIHSNSSFHSLELQKQYGEPNYLGYTKKHHKEEQMCFSPKVQNTRQKIDDYRMFNQIDGRKVKQKRKKRARSCVDQHFIEEIINRQYKPVQMFGRRNSEFSQLSAPVCRDHEFVMRDEIHEGSELCSCCIDDKRHKHRYVRNNDLSDMRSICDTRLYSSKKSHRHMKSRRHIDDYNNSTYYDIVPVKEKSSPKPKRKVLAENSTEHYQFYKEVPPSPRTHRPRLNLKAQNYTDYYDMLVSEREVACDNNNVPTQIPSVRPQANIGTMSSVQEQNLLDVQTNKTNNDTTLNTEITESNMDKTDKALGEIKDLLQSFLVEIKKESTHSDKSNETSKLGMKNLNESRESDNVNTTVTSLPNSGQNFNMMQCNGPSFLPTLPNTCCYPLIPVCPMNCLQSGYLLPNPSFTCTACANISKVNATAKEKKNETIETLTPNNETQELIKEIYKYVSQNSKSPPTKSRLQKDSVNSKFEKILLTNRSLGGRSKLSQHDANVGTPHMRCSSKSCEAIGSTGGSRASHSTNASQSDTALDKLSLQATQSSTESDVSSEVSEKKIYRNKFQKFLSSLRLFKKKKHDVIEELTESDSTVVESNLKQRNPYKQHIASYAMHGQEYFHSPPIPQNYPSPRHPHHCGDNYCFSHPRSPNYMYNQYRPHVHELPCPYDPQRPLNDISKSHSPHSKYFPYNQLPPQVPLCLKEVEVKSIATQSERKMSLLNKFTKKVQPVTRPDTRQQHTPPETNKPTFWKSLQEKTKYESKDPMDFSLKTQRQLAQGDIKLRNAMLKKLFYKRNPFSPRNLIVRTLLGKDKSSFGEPPKMYKPRMFI